MGEALRQCDLKCTVSLLDFFVSITRVVDLLF